MNKYLKVLLITSVFLTGCSGTAPKLGVDNGKLLSCPDSPNCVSSQSKDKEHFVKPFLITGTLSDVQLKLLSVLSDHSNAKVILKEGNYIKAEFTSSIFRFVDDVEFYFPNSKSGELTVHIRSASRLGHSDMGVNRKRIEEIRTELRALN